MNELAVRHSIQEIQELAKSVAESGLFGKMTPAQVFSLMMLCDADNLHPMQALRKYHIVLGKPSMRADAMHAEFQKIGGTITWETKSDNIEKQSALFSHPKLLPEPTSVSFSMDDARRAQLLGNDTWKKHPAPMMRSRVITTGLRMFAPGIIAGIYTPDEVEEFTARDVTTTARVVEPSQAKTRVVRAPRREIEHTPPAVVADELGKALETQLVSQGNGVATVAPPRQASYSSALFGLCSTLNEGWRTLCEANEIEYKALATSSQLEGWLITKEIEKGVTTRENFLDAKGEKSRARVVDYLNAYYQDNEPEFMRIATERVEELAVAAQLEHNVSPDED